MTRLCIATGEYYNPRETQVNFHIQNIFGGNTCVLFGNHRDADPFAKAGYAWASAPSETDLSGGRGAGLPSKIRSLLQHRTVRVPYGQARRNIQEFLHRENVDAVLCEFGTTAVRLAPVMNEIGVPVFTYFRGADASSHLRDPFRPEAYRRMMPRLSGVFSVCQFLLDSLAQHGIEHSNSHVVPSGVDTSLFVPGKKRTGSFVAVGRFIEKKRPDITVEAFCQAAKAVGSTTLEMIGDGPLLPQCKAIVEKHQMSDRVIFHGKQGHDFVRDRLATSEVFLQHSVIGKDGDTEGLPTAIQEAMSCGLVVISTRHAGIPEAVTEGETGYLVNEGDTDAFADRISRVSQLGDQLSKTAQRNRARAQERFDNRRLIKTVEREIDAVVAGLGSAGARPQ